MSRLDLGDQIGHRGLGLERVGQQQGHEDHLGPAPGHQLVDHLHPGGGAVIEKGDVHVELGPDLEQPVADPVAGLRHARVMAAVAEQHEGGSGHVGRLSD